MNYPTLKLSSKKVNAYKSSERGDMANCYSPLQNLDDPDNGRGAFTSEKLDWNQYTPIQMDIVPEYDGSVNIIMNDDINDPKLVNSGFSVLENNTYLVPEHLGNAVTNIYDADTLVGDTSLFKLYDHIPTLTFNGIYNGGSVKCGSYTFYFRLADADGNVTNTIQESGIVQVHMGDPGSNKIRMGQEDENAFKLISFTLSDLDKTFDYVRVFFERNSTYGEAEAATLYYMIDKNYPIQNSVCDILITGVELLVPITLLDVQILYADIQTAKTQAISNNVLFLGNVSSYELNYKKLRSLSWRILPSEVTSEEIGTISPNYKFLGGSGYYDMKNVYYYTGYWPDEVYRFGVVYIYGNNLVSNVFDLLGCNLEAYNGAPSEADYAQRYVDENDHEWWEYDPDDHFFKKGNKLNNSRGVFHFSKSATLKATTDYTIRARGIKFDFSGVADELKALDIKGIFFVRLKRVPTIIGQGMVVGLTDKDRGSLPVLHRDGGYITKSFLQSNRLLGGSTPVFSDGVTNQALLLPDGELLEGTYEDILNSQDFWLEKVASLNGMQEDGDHYSMTRTLFPSQQSDHLGQKVKLTPVPQGTKVRTNGTDYFSTIAGEPQDPIKVVDVKNVWNCTYPQNLTESTSLVRGEFGYYVGMSKNTFSYGTLVNIKNVEWANEGQMQLFFEEMFTNPTPFFAVSPRYNLSDVSSITCYRGDCFSSVFTHKMMSNFADPEYPTNTTIVDPKCWAKNFVVRATAKRSGTTFNNCKKSDEGFFIDPTTWTKTESLDIVEGATPFQNSIAEEVTIDVVLYPTSISVKEDEILFNDKGEGKKYSKLDVQELRQSGEDTIITYSEDVMIGETASSGDYKDTTDISGIIKGILLPMSITELVGSIKRLDKASKGISRQDAYSYIRLELPLPASVGFKLLDAWIKVQTSKLHNYVKRGRSNINRSDVNAVSIAQWVTFPVCSSINLALRDVDFHRDDEESKHNRKRSFYPYEEMNPLIHLPEASQINYATRKSISNNSLIRVDDAPFYRQEFFNRIYWSKPNMTDNIINSYRLVYNEQKIEYNKEWGSITKLVPYNGTLLVVFQHGIGFSPINLAPVTETETSQYMASKSVLQASLTPIATDIGSMWQDSIIGVNSNQYVFGVDTAAKKIWQLNGNSLKQISDLRVEKFLIDYIDLSEFDFNEYLGHVNVKTHFNAFKKDVIFTFYKDKAIWTIPDYNTALWHTWIQVFKKQIEVDTGSKIYDNFAYDNEAISISGNQITVRYRYYVYKEGDPYKTAKYIIRKGGIYDYGNRRLSIKPIISSWTTGTTWSLCYNLMYQSFTTLYDWYPLLSENIDNVWFTFDKDLLESALNNTIDIEVVTDVNTLKSKSTLSTSGFPAIDSVTWKNDEDFRTLASTKFIQLAKISAGDYDITCDDADLVNTYACVMVSDTEITDYETLYNNGFDGVMWYSFGSLITVREDKYIYVCGLKSELVGTVPTDELLPKGDFVVRNINCAPPFYSSPFTTKQGFKSELHTGLTGKYTAFHYLLDGGTLTFNEDTENAICWWEKPKDGKWDFKYSVSGTPSISLTKDMEIADIHFTSKSYLQSIGALDGDTVIPFSANWKYYHLLNSSDKESMKLWKHGQAGLYDNVGKLKPTNWYGKQHEFNFEFVAKGDDGKQKIWDNLILLSNKAEPTKFEFEVVGESYDWHEYKPIIEWINALETDETDPDKWWKYVLGKTSELILKTYPEFPDFYYEEQYGYGNRVIQKLPYLKMKLTDKKGTPERPVYSWDPERPKSYWEILKDHPEDKFSYNCSEVCLKENEQLNEQRVHSEQLGNSIRKYGRLRGNMEYREDNWKVEIRPTQFKWCYLNGDTLAFKTTETRPRDKYIKVRVRYSGEDLALITAIQTLFEDSYA